ncbi:MAG: ABC transporter permease [Planctomycetota bacterium]|nr:ABC transporter permease [Planctomycetota bacterium]
MIRIALSMLLGDRLKYIGVLFGVAAMSFLTTLLGSMFAGMLSRTYALVDDHAHADLWVMDPACETVTQTINMPETAVDRVRGVTGVASAARIALGGVPARFPHGRFVTIDVIGVDDSTLEGVPPTHPGLALRLREPGIVLLDSGGSRGQLVTPSRPADAWARGAPRLDAPTRPLRNGDTLLVNNAEVRVAGIVAGKPRMNPVPVLYTTYSGANRVLPGQRHRLTFVTATVTPGHDHAAVAREIERATGLRARTSAEFRRDTVIWFLKNSDVLSHVAVIVMFATAVGLAITGLLLYMFTTENARIYATLKALGASDSLLLRMVVAQALTAGALGYGLGMGLCCAIGAVLAPTGFPFRLMPYTPVIVAALVLAVTALAAVFSARAVLRVEPGIVFKG